MTGRPLTLTELAVLGHIAEGRSNPWIARRLQVSVRTVTGYVSNLFLALGVRNRPQLVAVAYQRGILRAPDGACCRRAVEGWLRAAADRLAVEDRTEGAS